MKLTKLDGRMNGYGSFTHYIDFRSVSKRQFIEMRQWCSDTFGPTVELDIWENYEGEHELANPRWTWQRDHFSHSERRRIFFATEADASVFAMKWL